MWYPVSDEVTAEPITLEEAKAQLSVDLEDQNDLIDGLIAAARAHVEAYCNRSFTSHEMVWACDSFGDFTRLPAAPAVDITSIGYIDVAGAAQTLPESTYLLRPDGLEPCLVLRPGQVWPQIQHGTRLTVSGTFGGSCPKDVKYAMLLLIGEDGETRGNAARPVWTTVDALLANHRRGAW